MDERPYKECNRIDLRPKDIFRQTGGFKIFGKHYYDLNSYPAVES